MKKSNKKNEAAGQTTHPVPRKTPEKEPPCVGFEIHDTLPSTQATMVKTCNQLGWLVVWAQEPS